MIGDVAGLLLIFAVLGVLICIPSALYDIASWLREISNTLDRLVGLMDDQDDNEDQP